MNTLDRSFCVRVQHGCLIIRDLHSEDDVSDWDPAESNWYKAGSSIIFGVLPGSEGWIDCEIWVGEPENPLAIQLFVEEIHSETGVLVVHDPNEGLMMRFRSSPGHVEVRALVNDQDFASKIQLCVRGLTESAG